MDDIQAKIDEMLDEYRDDPNFDEYQNKKDGGIDLTRLTDEEMRTLRKDLQLIFQTLTLH